MRAIVKSRGEFHIVPYFITVYRDNSARSTLQEIDVAAGIRTQRGSKERNIAKETCKEKLQSKKNERRGRGGGNCSLTYQTRLLPSSLVVHAVILITVPSSVPSLVTRLTEILWVGR